jgi:hypothetical protein
MPCRRCSAAARPLVEARLAIGERTHDTGAPTNFLHDPLEWIVGANLLPMNVGKRVKFCVADTPPSRGRWTRRDRRFGRLVGRAGSNRCGHRMPTQSASGGADAMFNFALLLQRKNQYPEAADYWRCYLASDSRSDWATRVRRSLKFCEMQSHLSASAWRYSRNARPPTCATRLQYGARYVLATAAPPERSIPGRTDAILLRLQQKNLIPPT